MHHRNEDLNLFINQIHLWSYSRKILDRLFEDFKEDHRSLNLANVELYIHHSSSLSNQSQSFSQSNSSSLFSQSNHSITQKYVNSSSFSSRRLNLNRKCQALTSLSSKLNDQDKKNQYYNIKDINEIIFN